jgi:hypothetical protein
MDTSQKQQAEKESQARILAEKALFQDSQRMMSRIVPCDDKETKSKADPKKAAILKKLYGF